MTAIASARYTLGIDTSNYRTSAALFDPHSGAWHNEGQLLTVAAGSIGLRQSEAVFQHTLRLQEQIAALEPVWAQWSCSFDAHLFSHPPTPQKASVPPAPLLAIGVSTRPRAVEGSYMPCFLVGENVARSLASILAVPLIPVSHQQGHIAAAVLSTSQSQSQSQPQSQPAPLTERLSLLEQPFLAWHLSGGTSELLLVRPGADGLPDCTCIGGTTDLAAGQLVDRVGARIGLSFPAGAALDALACTTAPEKGYMPQVTDCHFSLSGMQNQAEQKARTATPAQTARFTLETIANAVIRATQQAVTQYPYPILCAGGVMASQVLRTRIQAVFPHSLFAEPVLSGDNAVGVAVLAARTCQQHKEKKERVQLCV